MAFNKQFFFRKTHRYPGLFIGIQDESIAITKDNVIASVEVVNAELLTNTDGNHEYREASLPAYAITFKNPDCAVYNSTERGTFQTVRYNQIGSIRFLMDVSYHRL